jgi:hypothetical protein
VVSEHSPGMVVNLILDGHLSVLMSSQAMFALNFEEVYKLNLLGINYRFQGKIEREKSKYSERFDSTSSLTYFIAERTEVEELIQETSLMSCISS